MPIQNLESDSKPRSAANEAHNSGSDELLIDLSNADVGNKIGPASSLTSLNAGANSSEGIKRVQSDTNFTSRDKSKSFSVSTIYKADRGYSRQNDQDRLSRKESIYRNEISSLQQEVIIFRFISNFLDGLLFSNFLITKSQ